MNQNIEANESKRNAEATDCFWKFIFELLCNGADLTLPQKPKYQKKRKILFKLNAFVFGMPRASFAVRKQRTTNEWNIYNEESHPAESISMLTQIHAIKRSWTNTNL